MSRPIHHKLDVYGTELHLAFDKRAWGALRRINGTLMKAESLGITDSSTEVATAQHHLWLFIAVDDPRHAKPGELADTIAHEAAHAALCVFHRHGIDPMCGSGEPLAYLVGWFTGWIWRNMPARVAAQ